MTKTLNLMHIEESIRAIIADCCGISVDSCQSTNSLYELGIDSLALMSIISHLESQYPAALDDKAFLLLTEAQTVSQITAIVQSGLTR
jgi:acyl carrier protein